MTHEILLKIFKAVSLIDLSDCTFEYFNEENELGINANFEGRVIDAISYDGNLFYVMNNDGEFHPLNPMKQAFYFTAPSPKSSIEAMVVKWEGELKDLKYIQSNSIGVYEYNSEYSEGLRCRIRIFESIIADLSTLK